MSKPDKHDVLAKIPIVLMEIEPDIRSTVFHSGDMDHLWNIGNWIRQEIEAFVVQ
jgi:hypothetical protein